MPLTRHSVGPVDVVTLDGRLDAAAAGPVRQELKELIGSGRTRLVVNLAGVGFVDSSGLFALVASFKAARAVGGDVALVGLTPGVRSIVELTRLHRVFEIFDDEAVAVAALSGPRS